MPLRLRVIAQYTFPILRNRGFRVQITAGVLNHNLLAERTLRTRKTLRSGIKPQAGLRIADTVATGEAMSQKVPAAPKYRKHPNGQAFIEHRSIATPSHRLYLGQYGSEESHRRYREAAAQVLATGAVSAMPYSTSRNPSVSYCVAMYLEYAERYYGTKSSEFHNLKTATRGLFELFGSTLVADFGPRGLIALQQHWVRSNYARSQVNRLAAMVKRVFRWCSQQEIAPADTYHRLVCVEALKAGRTTAAERQEIAPVERRYVDALLPFLSPTVAAMVQVQYLCGMRPGEVCRMRAMDLVTSGPVWLYNVAKHKTAWRGRKLVKAVPMPARKLIEPLLTTDLEACLFSPRDAALAKYGRLTRKQEKSMRDHYDTCTYRQAIDYGFARLDTANKRERAKAAKESRKPQLIEIPHWHPNQLRHTIATEISQTLGEQAAQRWLGHEHLNTTGIYVQKEIAELVAIAQELERRWAS